MRPIRFIAMTTTLARHYQAGGADANGQIPETYTSDGDGVPCRHCLQNVKAGEKYSGVIAPSIPGTATIR